MRPDELFRTAWDASTRALESFPEVRERTFRIGDLPVRVRFAGPAMEGNVVPALSHLEAPLAASESGLAIRVWDGESTGAEPPFGPEIWNDCTPWGELAATRGSPVHASRLTDVGVYSMLDPAGGRGVYWANRAGQVPPYARAAAMRSMLHIWMRGMDRMFLHGAAVALNGDGVLLAGRGGSGKSTTALLCALHGWQYLGDDYCLASAGGRPRVYSLYNSAKLSPEQWDRFARWTGSPHTVKDPQSGKAVVFLAGDPAVRVIREAGLRAILLPEIGGNARTMLSPATAADAWKAMGPSTVLQLPGSGARDLAQIGGLARSTPCFRLQLGGDWDSIPSVIAEALRTVRGTK
jgi:hypothetical protein